MAHPGSSGGNMGRPSNPSGHFTPSSFPTPGSQQPHWTMMPQAGAGVPNAMPLQHFSGTADVHPLHGNGELAARVAAINTLPYQQPYNNYAHEQLDGYGGATSWTRPMLPPSGVSGSWAPPVVQQPGAGGQAASWAWAPPAQQRPGTGMPAAASPASGSVQAQVMTGKKTLEESLLEAGVLDEQTFEKIFLDDLAEEMQLGDDDGQAERDDRWVCLGDGLLALGAVSSSSSAAGPSTHPVRLAAQEQEAFGAGARATGGGDQAARERRSRRMAKRKEAKHAAHRGSQNGPGAI